MAEIFYDEDADLSHVQDRNVAVLGEEDESLAHALSLRDSGVDVRIGLLGEPGTGADHAGARSAMEGIPAVTSYQACEEADLVMVLTRQLEAPSVYATAIEPNLVPGDTVVFRHGEDVRSGRVRPPAGVDIALVAPLASAQLMRREFSEGRGVPMLVGVESDPSGGAWELALSYARAIGGTRAGAIKTTFAEEAESYQFGGRAALAGAVSRLVEAGFKTLVDAGCQPEVAYLQCVRELGHVLHGLYNGGVGARPPSNAHVGAHRDDGWPTYLIDESVRGRLGEVLHAIRQDSQLQALSAEPAADTPGSPNAVPTGGPRMQAVADNLRELVGRVRDFEMDTPA